MLDVLPIRIRGRLTTTMTVALLLVFAVLGITARSTQAAASASKPTVVLVHGAFADASGWNAVTERLQRRGYNVVAPPNPLRGVSADAAYLRSVLKNIKGPVVLVGHSYGGMVITNAATGNANVRALVYIAAYAPDEGDTVAKLGAQAPGAMVGPETLDITPFPASDGSEGLEGAIKPSLFRKLFAADLPASQTKVMAASQRPASLVALTEPSGPPAWRSIPSWYLIAGKDHTIGTANERIMAKRIGATTVELRDSSHVAMMSNPRRTVALILRASTAKAR